MRITILQSNFSKALAQISRVVGNRTTLPVLSNVLIVVEKGSIKISATDLEVGITTYTTGKIEEEGSITLPARLLGDFVNNNKDQSVEISTNGNIATLKSERFEAVIHGISAEEFPTVPEINDSPFVSMEKDAFMNSLKKVIIAPALDETRPVLAGISFSFNNKELILAATDSYRLAEMKIKLGKVVDTKKIVIPARTMNEVLRIMSGNEVIKEVVLYVTENQVTFKIGDTQIVSRLIEGVFPPYEQIIPTSHKIQVKTDLKEMLSSVKMLSLFAKDSANNNIRFIIKDKELTISSTATQAGSAKSKIKADVDGGDLEIAFNAQYILDVLNVLPHNNLLIEFNDSSSAGLIRTEKDQDFIYIIMPLKLES
jgi:DNA polymerase-3 subunit beta